MQWHRCAPHPYDTVLCIRTTLARPLRFQHDSQSRLPAVMVHPHAPPSGHVQMGCEACLGDPACSSAQREACSSAELQACNTLLPVAAWPAGGPGRARGLGCCVGVGLVGNGARLSCGGKPGRDGHRTPPPPHDATCLVPSTRAGIWIWTAGEAPTSALRADARPHTPTGHHLPCVPLYPATQGASTLACLQTVRGGRWWAASLLMPRQRACTGCTMGK